MRRSRSGALAGNRAPQLLQLEGEQLAQPLVPLPADPVGGHEPGSARDPTPTPGRGCRSCPRWRRLCGCPRGGAVAGGRNVVRGQQVSGAGSSDGGFWCRTRNRLRTGGGFVVRGQQTGGTAPSQGLAASAHALSRRTESSSDPSPRIQLLQVGVLGWAAPFHGGRLKRLSALVSNSGSTGLVDTGHVRRKRPLVPIPVTLLVVGRWVWCAKAWTGEVVG